MGLLNKLKNFNTLSMPVKASIALMFTQLIQKGLSVLTAPIYTRLLTTQEYGMASIFFSWYDILIIFTGLCLSKGVFNNGMMDFKDDRETFTLSMYSLTFISAAVLGTAVCLFCRFIYNFMKLPLSLIYFMFILLAFEASLSQWTVRQRFEYKWKATTIVTVTLAIVSPAVSIISLLKLSGNKVIIRVITAQSVFLVAYLGILVYLIIKAKGRIKTAYWKYALKFNLPLIPHYLSLHVLNHMDRIMIASIVGEAEAGIYSVAYGGSAVIKLFWQSMNASLIPWTYEKCSKKEYKRIADVTQVLIFSYALVCIMFMFLAPEVMVILAPSSYHEGIYVIPSVVAGVFFSALYYIFANIVYYYKKPKYVMVGSVVSAVSNVILNAIFIPVFGFLAAGYTTMVSYILQVVIDYTAMKKVMGMDIYDMRFIFLLSLGVTLVGVLLSFVYKYTLLRWGLLLIFLVVLVIYIYRHKEVFNQFLRRKK